MMVTGLSRMSSLLKYINNNREEALKIIVDGGYSEVEDVELAAQLLDDYDYDCCDGSLNDDVSEDVKYFAEKLHEIGYLESDPDEFAANLYQPISQDNSENMENSKASSEDPGDSADKSWDELVDVNWEENSTDLETGINMTYLTLGPEDGKPIVLIHGATDSRISWSQVAPKLAEQGYRVYVPELRGHGKTDKPKEDAYTLDEHESDILALINVLGLKKVNIVGHSLGTFIAEKLAIDYPELVSSITLIGAGYKVEHNEVIDWVLNGDGEGFDGVTAYKDGGEIPDDFIREWTSTVNEDKNFADAIYLQAKNLPNYAWAAIFNGLNGTNLSGELDKITAPVLIIWGSEDIVFPENEQKELQSYLTNAEKVDFVTIDGADHNTHWASDEVAGRIANLIGKEAL